MEVRIVPIIVALLAGVGALVTVAAQQPPVRDSRSFRASIDLISVTATVTDKDGHLVAGLPREAFEIYEDGDRQTLTQFTNERVPVGLGLLLDISDSMFGKRIADARTAVDRFLLELLAPEDECFIVAFNHQPHVLTTWTRQPDVVPGVLDTLRPSGGTAAYDAIAESLPILEARTRARAALLLISDGADTASNATQRDLRSLLLRSDAFVYAIAIDSSGSQPINTRVDVQALRDITGETGGRTEIVQSSADLTAATTRIAEELNSQYVLGYTSSHGADGKFHSIRVRATIPDYRVRARKGYVAQ